MVAPGKWLFQANVTSFGLTSTTQALLAGTGSLYSWGSALNRGHGGWQLVKSNVTYKAIANAAAKAAAASFGTTIDSAPWPGLPQFLAHRPKPGSDLNGLTLSTASRARITVGIRTATAGNVFAGGRRPPDCVRSPQISKSVIVMAIFCVRYVVTLG